MPFDRHRYMWQLSAPYTELEAREAAKSPEALFAAAIDLTKSFEHPIRAAVNKTSLDLITGTPVYDRDVHSVQQLVAQAEPSWARRVTMIGDSAHPMSPFKGQGANQAIIDAWNLSQFLLTQNASIESAFDAISTDMYNRVSSKVQGSRDAIELLHGEAFLEPAHHWGRKGLPKCQGAKLEQMMTLGMSALNTTRDEYDAFI